MLLQAGNLLMCCCSTSNSSSFQLDSSHSPRVALGFGSGKLLFHRNIKDGLNEVKHSFKNLRFVFLISFCFFHFSSDPSRTTNGSPEKKSKCPVFHLFPV